MLLREEYEAREDKLLAPYAVRSKNSRGRKFPESPHEFRPAFQRDKERIIYTSAFRRLEYKTQVFVNHEGDHYRTRLTHSVEVSLVARSIARTLLVNEDLVEAIALAHDLGHSPFGHAGETVLNRLMKEEGGFEHNRQSLRLLEELENSHPDYKGLNLSFETLEGIKKHSQARMNALEFQIVNLSDDIAYNAHDLDDGLRSNYLSLDAVKELRIWPQLKIDFSSELSSVSNDYYVKSRTIRRLINYQILDVIRHTQQQVDSLQITSLEDLQKHEFNIVSFSSQVAEEIKELRLFLKKELYQHPRVLETTGEAQRVIEFLFKDYCHFPKKLPSYFAQQIEKEGLKRVVCDYVAGMTDRFAYREYEKIQNVL